MAVTTSWPRVHETRAGWRDAARAARQLLRAVAVLICAAGDAQAAGASTRVFAAVASYADTGASARGPTSLRKHLQTLSDFYAEGSGGTHDFVGSVHPQTLAIDRPRPGGKCRLPDPALLSAALRDAGVSLKGYHALALVVPASAGGCSGGVQTAFRHREADGSVRSIPLAVSWSFTSRFIAHEILHTHGLGHAKALACHKASLAASCRTREYGNTWDVMGNGSYQMLSAPLRTHMRWTEPVMHADGRARYTIGAATRPGGLPTAVRVRLPFEGDGAVRILQPLSLWIEYRPPLGFDGRMASPRFVNFATGAMLNVTGAWQRKGDRAGRMVSCPVTSPCLVDTVPETGKFHDAGLVVGRTWTEPFSGTQVTVESRTETTLTFTVAVP
jgi:hypothetical protein